MNQHLPTESETPAFLQALQDGDRSVFSAVYDHYAPILKQAGHNLTQDENLIEDCMHDVFLKFFSNPYQGTIHNLGSYLVICLRNKLIDEFRRYHYYSDVDMDERHISTVDDSAENSYINDESHDRMQTQVHHLLHALTPRQQEVFTLYYIEERKYDEICQIMNMNYHSVRNLVHRGMVKLRSVAV